MHVPQSLNRQLERNKHQQHELTHQNIFVQPKCAVLFLDCLSNITQTFVVNNSPSVTYEMTQVIKQTKMFWWVSSTRTLI